jgi:hydroxymethylglutaryl-CoA synthase
MIGIVSYGAYIPKWRMPLDFLVKNKKGERSVAGTDEDSITMAVSAVLDCLKSRDRSQVDGLFFASTTSPFAEKQGATLIAKAASLQDNIITADLGGSLKAGTTALKLASDVIKAGSAKQIVVVAADCRLGEPGSEHELNNGDGSAALLIGDQDVAVSLESTASVSNEIFDVWRRSNDTFISSWESRFDLTDGYMKSMQEAIVALMRKTKLKPQDIAKVVLYCPNGRASTILANELGFDSKSQLQFTFSGILGSAGTASTFLLLGAALDEAKNGDNVLLASYGNGSDALYLKINDNLNKIRERLRIKILLESKRMIPDYLTYLKWRGLLARKEKRVLYTVTHASAPAIWRERARILCLNGSKCNACGAIEYPPQRICARCHTKDSFELVPLYDKKGKIFTSARDPISNEIVGLVNFEGGGRIFCYLTDGDLSEFEIDTPVEMSFRKLELLPQDTIVDYFWKAVPLRNGRRE